MSKTSLRLRDPGRADFSRPESGNGSRIERKRPTDVGHAGRCCGRRRTPTNFRQRRERVNTLKSTWQRERGENENDPPRSRRGLFGGGRATSCRSVGSTDGTDHGHGRCGVPCRRVTVINLDEKPWLQVFRAEPNRPGRRGVRVLRFFAASRRRGL